MSKWTEGLEGDQIILLLLPFFRLRCEEHHFLERKKKTEGKKNQGEQRSC